LSRQRKVLKIGITSGDPAGIGPEVLLKALKEYCDPSFVPVVIGSAEFFSVNHKERFTGFAVRSGGSELPDQPGPLFVDIPLETSMPVPGRGTPETGKESLKYVDAALDLWESGEIDAMVTGPVSKGLIERSGTPFTGHTEYIAARTGGEPYMMMYSGDYRVILVTTHIPIAEVAAAVSLERIERVISAAHASMSAIDGGRIRLAVAGLDPHCGDDGAIGAFDRDVTAEAVRRARERGIDIEGPFAADTLFIASKWARYNAVIAHYHDQGLVPFKQLAFDRGVNVTLGLPIVRTSVDHGTAFDIAGRNRAGYNSMIEAISLACRLRAQREN